MMFNCQIVDSSFSSWLQFELMIADMKILSHRDYVFECPSNACLTEFFFSFSLHSRINVISQLRVCHCCWTPQSAHASTSTSPQFEQHSEPWREKRRARRACITRLSGHAAVSTITEFHYDARDWFDLRVRLAWLHWILHKNEFHSAVLFFHLFFVQMSTRHRLMEIVVNVTHHDQLGSVCDARACVCVCQRKTKDRADGMVCVCVQAVHSNWCRKHHGWW